MDKDKKEFILHIAGLVVLSVLAVFFAILQVKYNVEVTDTGLILGGILTIVTGHAAQRVKQGKNDAPTE